MARRGLQAELSVGGLGVVGEGDGVGQLAVVQHLLVVLRQVDVALRLELEGALWGDAETRKRLNVSVVLHCYPGLT